MSMSYRDTNGMGEAERKQNQACSRDHREFWVVLQRECNYSAFNGYRYTPSDYSTVACHAPGCGRAWRTKAAYVGALPDVKR
jgi:hypothetical protein